MPPATTDSSPAAAPTRPDDAGISDDILSLAARRFGVTLPAASATSAAPSAAASGAAGGDDAPPAREEGETDEAYAARLEDAGHDSEAVLAAEAAANDTGEETDEARAARLQQQEGETDEAYEARLAEENLTRDDVPEAPAATEPTAEEKKAAAQKARDDADLKKLPEGARKAAQAIIDSRIGRITAKTKAEKAELEGKLATLTAELEEAKAAAEGKAAPAVVASSIHPLLLDPSEKAIADYLAGVEAFEDFAAEHEDGYEPTAEELAKGYKPATKAELRSRLRAIQRERDKLVPQARELIGKRATADAEARKLLPAFFDATKPEYQAARSLLREQPELKRFPDYMTRAAEIVLGRKALADLRAQAGKPPVKKPAPRAPRAPGGSSAPKGGPLERKNLGTDAPAAVATAIKTKSREDQRKAALAVLM